MEKFSSESQNFSTLSTKGLGKLEALMSASLAGMSDGILRDEPGIRMKYTLRYKLLSLASVVRFILLRKPDFILDASWEVSSERPINFKKLVETFEDSADDKLIPGDEFARLSSRYYSYEEIEAARIFSNQRDFDYYLDQGHPVIYRTDDEEIVKLLTLLELSDASDLDEIEWGLNESLINFEKADPKEFTFKSIDPLLLLRTIVKLEEPMIEGEWEIQSWRAGSVDPRVQARPESEKPTSPDLLESMIFVKNVEEIILVRRGEGGSELMRVEFLGESAKVVMPISPHSDFLDHSIQRALSKPYVESLEGWYWDQNAELQEAKSERQPYPSLYYAILLVIALGLGTRYYADAPHDLGEDATWRLNKSSSGQESVCIQPGIEAEEIQRITAEWKTVNDLHVTGSKRMFFSQPAREPMTEVCFARPAGKAAEGRQDVPTVRKVGRGGRLSLISEAFAP